MAYQQSYEYVYVLSLPGFIWMEVSDLSDETNREQQAGDLVGRDQASCQVYNGAQMIVLGGNIRNGSSSFTNGTCNDDLNPVRVLDCLLYTSPSPRDGLLSRMPSSA